MSFSFSRLGKGSGAGSYYESELAKSQQRAAQAMRVESAPDDALGALRHAAQALKREHALALLERSPGQTVRDRAASVQDGYYVSSREPAGQWWSLAGTIVRDGAEVDVRTFRSVLAGYDPQTGDALCQRPGEDHLAGYDMTLSAPKSVSVLWMAGDERLRARIEAAQSEAVKAAYGFIAEHGLIVVRSGKDGVHREAAEDVMIARFRHHTSRKGDPQLHDHGVIINIGRGADGRTRAIDTADLLQWQGAIAASYRVKLAEEMAALGFRMEKVGRNCEVVGVPEALCEQFSKRRTEIEDAAREHHLSTAADRARARVLATDTRDAKDKDLSPEVLQERWTGELRRAGYRAEDVVELARGAVLRPAAETPIDGLAIVKAAVAEATLHESVIEARHLWRLVLEHSQGRLALDEVGPVIAAAERSGELVKLGEVGRGVYSTREIIALERQMILDACDRPVMAFDPAAVERAIGSLPLSEQQARMIRHLTAGSAVVVGEGSAGSGKSLSSQVLVEAAEASGMVVKGFAPSWKAAGVLRRESRLEEVAALQGYLNRLDRGDEAMSGRDCIIVDEAGMVPLRDMARLLGHAREAGARVVLLGDRRQLEAVGAGSPLSVIAAEVGGYRLTEIRRQADELAPDGSVVVSREWMRRASMRLADGEGAQALATYDAMDRMRWCESREATIAALVADWTAGAAKGGTQAVITPRNADVRELNERLRASYRAAGGLIGEDVTVEAVDRSGVARSLLLAAGDRLAFGERVKELDIDTSDLATVRGLRRRGSDLELTVALDKDQEKGQAERVRVVMLSALVGWRPEGGDRLPRLQHGYAGTLHLSQGQTVDRSYVANLSGLDRRAQYVAMTRHRHEVVQYVDGERVRELLQGRERGAKPSAEDVKRFVFAEALRESNKKNVVEFIGDKAAWLETGRLNLAAEPELPGVRQPAPAADLSVRMSRRIEAQAGPERPRPMASGLRQRLAERLQPIAESVAARLQDGVELVRRQAAAVLVGLGDSDRYLEAVRRLAAVSRPVARDEEARALRLEGLVGEIRSPVTPMGQRAEAWQELEQGAPALYRAETAHAKRARQQAIEEELRRDRAEQAELARRLAEAERPVERFRLALEALEVNLEAQAKTAGDRDAAGETERWLEAAGLALTQSARAIGADRSAMAEAAALGIQGQVQEVLRQLAQREEHTRKPTQGRSM